jgi:hypothetical protein
VVGRPYLEHEIALVAPLVQEQGTVLDTKARRAAAWAKAGAGEHASVAAFSRLSLQLMALGAPTELLFAVHQAALDEIGHADICWSVARELGGVTARPGAFPFGESVKVQVALAELAASAVRDGCLAESLGAHVTSVAAELAPDPIVREALTTIAAEEATHAVLSFRLVAWAIHSGGAEVKAAVRAALLGPWPRLDVQELALRTDVEERLLQAAAGDGVAHVLRPAIERLLAA